MRDSRLSCREQVLIVCGVMADLDQKFRTFLRLRGWQISMFAAVALLSAQIAGAVHGGEYGFDAHTHDGEICEFVIATDDQTAIDPTITVQDIEFSQVDDALAFYTEAALDQSQRQRPPTRAPPLSNS